MELGPRQTDHQQKATASCKDLIHACFDPSRFLYFPGIRLASPHRISNLAWDTDVQLGIISVLKSHPQSDRRSPPEASCQC